MKGFYKKILTCSPLALFLFITDEVVDVAGKASSISMSSACVCGKNTQINTQRAHALMRTRTHTHRHRHRHRKRENERERERPMLSSVASRLLTLGIVGSENGVLAKISSNCCVEIGLTELPATLAFSALALLSPLIRPRIPWVVSYMDKPRY